jgi:sialate O-acetylesterase
MITSWRNQWGQGDFPFYFVQLANYQKIKPEPAEDSWAELREAQAMTIALPRTGMAVAIDIGDEKTIHPLNKKDVGERLARWALAKDYGREVIFCGPVYKSMKTEDGKIILTFDHTDGGLIAGNNAPLKQFAIAGADKKFVWADAEIAGDTVVVKNQQVPDPVAVRYAWQTNPQGCNLYNKAGLPASPFRTDDWPGVTAGKDNP